MATPIRKIQDGDTVRDLTAAELEQRIIDEAAWVTDAASEVSEAAAKKSAYKKLAALGLTADEIAAL